MPALQIVFTSLTLLLAGELPACSLVFCRTSLIFLEIFWKGLQPATKSILELMIGMWRFGWLFIALAMQRLLWWHFSNRTRVTGMCLSVTSTQSVGCCQFYHHEILFLKVWIHVKAY